MIVNERGRVPPLQMFRGVGLRFAPRRGLPDLPRRWGGEFVVLSAQARRRRSDKPRAPSANKAKLDGSGMAVTVNWILLARLYVPPVVASTPAVLTTDQQQAIGQAMAARRGVPFSQS